MSLRWMTGVVAAIFAVAVAAQVPAEGGDQKRRLIEQKIRLVEALLNSPAARGAAEGSDADPRSLIEQGKQAIGEARKALAEARFDEAAKLADDALRSVSSASRRMSPGEGGLPESAQRKNLQDLGDQVGMYRNSVEELAKDSQRAAPAERARRGHPQRERLHRDVGTAAGGRGFPRKGNSAQGGAVRLDRARVQHLRVVPPG